MAWIAGADGWTLVDAALFVCFLIATPWTVLGFWNAVIGLWLLHGRSDGLAQVAPFAASGERDDPLHVEHRGRDDAPQRGSGPGRGPARGSGTERECDRAWRLVRLFRPERHLGPCGCPAEEETVDAWRRAAWIRSASSIAPRPSNTGIQSRKRARILRNARPRLRPDAAARRRQPDGRCDHRAPGAHHAGPSETRHPAEPRGRRAVDQRASPASSSSACATACGPTPWARRGGSASAGRSGATTPWCASRPSSSIASCPSCPAGRRSAGRFCRHDQVEAALMRRAGYEVRVLPDGVRKLGGEPADRVRVLGPRPALVPGQHAVLAAPRAAGP